MINKKLKIGVLMGGPSAEHDISLATGQNVLENLDISKYLPVAIRISKDKKWFLNNKITTEEKALKGHDLIFNALHGEFGEDGRVQALMEYRGVKYTGSGICGSALAMDKLRSREIFKLAGLQVPKTLKIRENDNYQALLNVFVTKITKFPVVVKPCSSGSSVGVEIVDNQYRLEKVIKATFKMDSKVLIEELLQGREMTCGVLDPALQQADASGDQNHSLSDGVKNFLLTAENITALPVTEIIPMKGNKFFNFKAKYKTGHADEIIPAKINEDTTKRIQNIAIKAHQLLGCKAYSRTDMIISNTRQGQLEFGQGVNDYNNIYVLETNTLPGLTRASLFPKAANSAGLTTSQLIDKIISSSLA